MFLRRGRVFKLYIYAMLCYAKSLQSCPTLCDPRDGSTPGSPVPGILQARTLEWGAIAFSDIYIYIYIHTHTHTHTHIHTHTQILAHIYTSKF